MAVKGSVYHSMRIIPHRPLIKVLCYVGFFLAFALCILASYYAGIYRVESDQYSASSSQAKQHQQLLSDTTQELTRLRTNAEVDRQTIEDMRQLAVTQKAQIAAAERDLIVYKDLLSPGAKANPLGISFGVFTVFALPEKGRFKYSLVVQKLSAKDADFSGAVDFRIMGEQGGKAVVLPLYQVSEQLTSPTIDVAFKYFQTLEGEFTLPGGFAPQHVHLAVKSGDKKSAPIVETQLEWPISSH